MEVEMGCSLEILDDIRVAVMVTNVFRQILSINRAFTEITGYLLEDVVGKSPAILYVGFHERQSAYDAWSRAEETGHWQGEIRNSRKNGEIYPVWFSISAIRNDEGTLTHFISIFSDISEQKALEDRVSFMAHHDPLTELPNRILLERRFKEAVINAQRNGSCVGLMFLDLNHFKAINDSLGHIAGDDLLVGVSRRLLEVVREEDTVSRLGGDEFVIVLTEIGLDEISVVAEKIVDCFREPVVAGRLDISVSFSIGIAVVAEVVPEDGRFFEQVLRKADMAMYHAKREGGIPFRFYDDRMDIDTTEGGMVGNNSFQYKSQGVNALIGQARINSLA
jgi:diguanylate cyclase (GGDEF)-like protein/PAS domain S-box-containing protein